jgi:hypothetical protein
MCSTSEGKGPSSSKEPTLIPCKSLWALLTLKIRLKGRGLLKAYKAHNPSIPWQYRTLNLLKAYKAHNPGICWTLNTPLHV